MQEPGLIVAPLTPFTHDLKLDEPALLPQIDYIVSDFGATMVVAAGVETQEYKYLSFEQRRALIRRTIKFVDGRAVQRRRVELTQGLSHHFIVSCRLRFRAQ
jgi:4-hydroxy-tetrahydrodipicolinate synthase